MDKIEFAIQVRAELDKALAELRQADGAVEDIGAAGERASRGFAQLKRASFAASQSIRDTLDPTRALHREIIRLRQASARGLISTRTAEAGVARLKTQLRATGTAAATTDTRLSRLQDHASRVTRGFRDLRRAVLLAFVATEVIRFTQALVDANVEYQRIEFTLRAVTGSAAGANKELQFVTDVSKRLGLDLQSTAQGYARVAVSAKSAGIANAALHKSFEGLAETFTVLHTLPEDVNGLLVQLEQGLSLGKFQMQDFRAIAQHLPGTLEIAKEAARELGGSLADMLAHGGVPAKEFFEKFTALLHDKYGPEAKDAAHSLNAEINRLHTTLFEISTDPSMGFADTLAKSIANLNHTLNDPGVRTGLQDFIRLLGETLDIGVRAAAAIGSLATNIQYMVIKGWRDQIQQQIKNVSAELESGRTAGLFGHILSEKEIAEHRQRLRQLLAQDQEYSRREQEILSHAPGAPKPKPPQSNPEFQKDFANFLDLKPVTGPYHDVLLGRSAAEKALDRKLHGGGDSGQLDAAQKIIAQLQAQGAAYGQTSAAALRYKLQTQGATEAEIQEALAQQDVNDSLAFIEQMGEDAAAAKKQQTAASQQHQAALEKEAAAILDQIDPTRELARQIAIVKELTAAGLLTPAEGRAADVNYVVTLAEDASTLKAQLAAVQNLVAKGLIPAGVGADADAQLKQIWNAAHQTQSAMNQFAVQAARNIQDSFANFLFDPFKDGLKGLVSSFSDALRQMVAQMASQAILTGIFKAFGWQVPGFGAPAAGAGHAAGGYISGPGTGTSDSIPARLSNGEYVLRAAAVQHWGVGFLNQLNGLTARTAGPGFAAGGLVTAGAGGGNTYVEVVNNTGAPVHEERSQRGNGDELVRIVVGAVSDDVARGGRMAQTLQGVYGLARRGRR